MNTPEAPPVIGRSVRCSLDRWDVLRCRLWVLAHNKKVLAILLLMCLGFPLLNYHKPQNASFPILEFGVYFLVTVGLLIALYACFLVAFNVLWLFITPNRGVVGEHDFEIREDAFWEKSPFNESLHRWSGFYKVARSRNFLFVFVTDNIVHYIPVNAFASKEEADAFQAELQKRANL